MAILHLGVLDIPYDADPSPALTTKQIRHKKRNDVRAAYGLQEYHGTTGDVAEILETKYHVMEIFFELHAQEIADDMAASLGASLEDALSGGQPNYQPVDTESFIKELFNKFIDGKEMDGLSYPGIPTAAAKAGVNHRLKHPFAKDNPERPSFKDTGTYEGAFRAWIEQ